MSCKWFTPLIFEYNTIKFVNIKSKAVGILSRLIQCIILGYVIGYAIIYSKGYQKFGGIESSVTTKLKGVVYINESDDSFNPSIEPSLYKRIWDIPDIIVPPSIVRSPINAKIFQDNGAFFVTTNLVITSMQTLSTCAEDPSVPGAICEENNNTCVAGIPLMLGNGVMTGKCLQINDTVLANHSCEIEAWCPVEKDINPLKNKEALLKETKHFTVLIKNSVDFPLFNIRRRNIKDTANKTYLSKCRYHPESDPECPVFVLGDIIKFINKNETAKSVDYDILAKKGGVIAIIINWDCNFDFDEKECMPTYSFRRLDDPVAKISPGWNFRYAHYYNDRTRTLFKAYGIKFDILVNGRGGKFNIVPLLINVGAGLGLFAAQGFLCDIVILYFMKNSKIYKNEKYESVDEENPIIPSDDRPSINKSKTSNYERFED